MECKQIKSLFEKNLTKKKNSSLDPDSDVCIRGSQIFKGKNNTGVYLSYSRGWKIVNTSQTIVEANIILVPT